MPPAGPVPSRAPHVAVVGAGVSGLAAAHRLRTLLGPRAQLTVLDQRARVGGVLRTVDLAGVPFDVGAEAFLARRPEVPALLDELGLAGSVVHPSAARASVRAAGLTRPLPGATLMGVPTSSARLADVLSPAGLTAVAAEPHRPLDWTPGADVALGPLLRERFGAEVPDRLVGPLLGGVYAGRLDELGLRATVPALAGALDRGATSLVTAADDVVGAATPGGGPVFGAVRGGYQVLLDVLGTAAGARLRLRTTVRALDRTPDGWRLTLGPTTAPEALDVDAVVLAVPAPAAARLLGTVARGAARAAGEIELASSVVVGLAYRPGDACDLPGTSGVLVAADEPLSIKAATYSTTKWPQLSPDGLVRLRASLGRFGEARTLQVDDAELVARVRADLATLAGLHAPPVAVHVQRWGGGLPQYGPGHLDRVAALERGLPAGVAVAGAALHGVGVPACIATARTAAERIVSDLRHTMATWLASTTPN